MLINEIKITTIIIIILILKIKIIIERFEIIIIKILTSLKID
jgi:hypothetical protein